MASLITKSCDSFLKILSECMLISTSSIRGGGGEGVIVYPPETPTDMSRYLYIYTHTFMYMCVCVQTF